MKKLFYLLFAFCFFFLSCEEEIGEPSNSTSSFICKIDGEQLYDSSPEGYIITDNTLYNGALEITASSNLANGKVMNTVTIRIGSNTTPFSIDNFQINTDYTLALPGDGKGQVWILNDLYETSGVPGASGEIRFSKIASNKVSGTFSFQGHLDGTGGVCIVTDGEFSNVIF